MVTLGRTSSIPIMRAPASLSATFRVFVDELRPREGKGECEDLEANSIKNYCLHTAVPEISSNSNWIVSVSESKTGGVHPLPMLLMHMVLLRDVDIG